MKFRALNYRVIKGRYGFPENNWILAEFYYQEDAEKFLKKQLKNSGKYDNIFIEEIDNV